MPAVRRPPILRSLSSFVTSRTSTPAARASAWSCWTWRTGKATFRALSRCRRLLCKTCSRSRAPARVFGRYPTTVVTYSRTPSPFGVLQHRAGSGGRPEMLELASALHLRPYQATYEVKEVTAGQLRTDDGGNERTEVSVTTRSVLEVMYLLSHNVAAPKAHIGGTYE